LLQNAERRYKVVHPNLVDKPTTAFWEVPHWMTWLGGILQVEGFNTKAMYFNFDQLPTLTFEKMEEEIKNTDGDVFMLSPMTENLHSAFFIADKIKEYHPNATILFGGVLANPMGSALLAHPSVDYLITDRGDKAVPEFLKAFVSGQDVTRLPQVGHKNEDGEIIISKEKYDRVPLSTVPMPKVDLFDKDIGPRFRYHRQVYGQGCPFKCGFCTITTIGIPADYFSPDRVVEEIHRNREYYESNEHHVYFGDETFTQAPKRVIELNERLKLDGSIHYDCQTRLNCLQDKKMLQLMKEGGASWVEVGIESVNVDSAHIFKQGIPLHKLETILGRVRDAGLPTCSFLIHGLPNQTIENMHQSTDMVCDLIKKNLLTSVYFENLVPFPGSEIYNKPEEFGVKLHHQNFSLYRTNLPPVYDTAHCTSQQISDAFHECLERLADALEAPCHFEQ